ncbi:MAG: hypothetical protein FJY29_13320 [Betaproteobacteria bacterium]|nr:hypothetical protein [Betaproteobacteria bacterium]
MRLLKLKKAGVVRLARKFSLSFLSVSVLVLLSCFRAAPPIEKGDYWDTTDASQQPTTDPSTLHPQVRRRKSPLEVSTWTPPRTPVSPQASSSKPIPRAPEDYFPAPGAKPTVAPTGAPAPRLLNVAILTKSVECVWCHMNIYGDVGGLDFSAGSSVNNVNIFGKVYGTKGIPSAMKSGARDGYDEFYQNSNLKIFPLTVDASGTPVFPNPKESEIESKVSGRFRYNSKINGPVVNESLYIPPNTHFEIAGDILVKGDLVIAGTFSGQGTLYARNIFIPGDIIAQKNPYPFSETYSTALEEARASIARADDSLHFYALGQITVGSIQNGLSGIVDRDRNTTGHEASPYTAAQPADTSKISAYTQQPPGNCTAHHYNPHVKRVDAFLYAADYITWRACGGYQLNGGFVAPIVVISSNWTPAAQNITRYDYRFRVGSTGFLALQDYFNSASSP